MRVLSLSHDYPGHAPRVVWDLAISYAALHYVCAPLLTFEGAPVTGRIQPGDDLSVRVRLFGRLPPQDYRMHLIECDDAAMRFVSDETGAGVERWRHRLQVTATDQGARIDEEIEIEAGWLTPVFVRWARYLYRHRHPRRLAILRGDVTL